MDSVKHLYRLAMSVRKWDKSWSKLGAVPSGKNTKKMENHHFFMGKLTISMAMFGNFQ